jgi:hypothetical protein
MRININCFNLLYYEDLRNFPSQLKLFDEDGIPLIRIYGKVVYNPTTVALFTLSSLQHYLLGSRADVHIIAWKKGLNWLLSNGITTDKGYLLPLNFDHPPYKLKKGWISAMTQGLAVSGFVRAYLLTKDELFLKFAYEASKPLMIDVKLGGVAYRDQSGIWLEEAPPSSHILNGFIYAILGLFVLFSITKDSRVQHFLETVILTLKKNIKKYDNGYWSLYQLSPPLIAPLDYHLLHVHQLFVLYKITDIDVFKEYAIRFYLYKENKHNLLKSRIHGNILSLKRWIKTLRLHAFHYMTLQTREIIYNKIT